MIKHVVKPMQRGQITIPQDIRDAMNITPNTYLWVKMQNNKRIIIQPVDDIDEGSGMNLKPNSELERRLSMVSKLPNFKEWESEPDLYSMEDGKPLL